MFSDHDFLYISKVIFPSYFYIGDIVNVKVEKHDINVEYHVQFVVLRNFREFDIDVALDAFE